MRELIVNDYFEKTYLTCGKTYDNFIFENCPIELIKKAQTSLSKPLNCVKPCLITITEDIEHSLESTLDKCENDFKRKIITRDFVSALFLYELLKGDEMKLHVAEEVKEGISSILSGDLKKAIEFITHNILYYEVKKQIKEVGKVELNLFLIDTKNILLQQSINNYISSREPFSVKVFTTNKKLPAYCDLGGILIESPHDYMKRDVNEFIKFEEKSRDKE